MRRACTSVVAGYLLLFISGCSQPNNKVKDVSGIDVKLHWHRFDRDLIKLLDGDFEQQATMMHSRYNPFFNIYLQRQMTLPGDEQLDEETRIKKFLSDPYVRSTHAAIETVFANDEHVQQELLQAFTYLKFYFPGINTPEVIAANSLLNQDFINTVLLDSLHMVVFLDQYLGSHYSGYDSAGYYRYLVRKMEPQYLARNAMAQLYDVYFGTDAYVEGRNLLQAMIEQGKKYYFIEHMLPEAADSLIAGFTGEQTSWCRASEKSIWQFFNEHDLLYKKNYLEQKRYLNDGPTTPNMPPESPGNVGSWVGWQIVRAYMNKHGDEVSLRQLLTNKTAEQIFRQSAYKP